MENQTIIRTVNIDDAQSICDIYNYYVINTAITFETNIVTLDEMQKRIKEVLNNKFPYFVALVDNKLVGYCYLHSWNGRCAYSSTKEVSIYLDKSMLHKGIGKQLFKHLLMNINKSNTHVLISGICIPNEPSIRLHEEFGFKKISHMKEIGWKFGKWRDVGHWELIFPTFSKVLILCTGNSCRSQMAQAFLQSFNPLLDVRSAGTEPAREINQLTVKVMSEIGIDISHSMPTNVNKYVNEAWDYVITVCNNAHETCPAFIGHVKKQIHIGFDDPSIFEGSVENQKKVFRRVRDEIKNRMYDFYISNIK